MSEAATADPGAPAAPNKRWGINILIGLLFIVAGTSAILLPLASTWAVIVVVGASLIVSGIAQIVHDSRVRRRFAELVETYGRQATGSSTRIERIVLLDELPSLDVGEVTDKGSINQRAVLDHRVALVEDLYAANPSPRVITAKESIANVA